MALSETVLSGGPTDGRMAFDSSQWTVSTGRETRATGGARFDSTGGPFGGGEMPGTFQTLAASSGGQNTMVYIAAAVGAAIVLYAVVSKRKKKGG